MEVKRILHVIGGMNRGGAETMAMNLYRAIDKNTIQFDFVVHSADENAYFNEIEDLGGNIYVFPRFTGINILSYMKFWDFFLAKHSEYKIIHSHVRSYALPIIQICKMHNRKVIVHSHSTSNGSGIKAIIKDLLQMPIRYKADYLAACSLTAGEWLFGKNATKKENYLTVNNAIDTRKYIIAQNIRDKYVKDLNIVGKDVFGHVGRLSKPKNHLFLLDVFSKIREKNQNAVLLIVGEGEEKEKINERITELNLKNAVLMLGSRSDVPTLLSIMDVFVFPSLWEGLPVTVIEAQAAGLPCLVSDSITDEINISPAIHRMKLSEGCQRWAEEAIKLIGKRYDAIQQIEAAGFDIYSEATKMKEFYLKCWMEDTGFEARRK